MENPAPERREASPIGSWFEVPAEADDAFDATEALCAARRSVSSRVRRLTCK